MDRDRPSRTAIWVSLLRGAASYEKPPVVSDPIASELVPAPYAALLALARLAPRVMSSVVTAADRVSGGRARHLSLRTRALDDALVSALPPGDAQVVTLGAGLCARAWRLPELARAVVFEVDHPATQRYKRSRTASLALLAKEVRFVPVDFETDNLSERLAEAGHDPARSTVFLWEGVIMYLSLSAIEATLGALERLASDGSTLLATYNQSAGPSLLSRFVKGVGEPFRSTFTASEMSVLLGRFGFRVASDTPDVEWSERYLGTSSGWNVERLVRAVKA